MFFCHCGFIEASGDKHCLGLKYPESLRCCKKYAINWWFYNCISEYWRCLSCQHQKQKATPTPVLHRNLLIGHLWIQCRSCHFLSISSHNLCAILCNGSSLVFRRWHEKWIFSKQQNNVLRWDATLSEIKVPKCTTLSVVPLRIHLLYLSCVPFI